MATSSSSSSIFYLIVNCLPSFIIYGKNSGDAPTHCQGSYPETEWQCKMQSTMTGTSEDIGVTRKCRQTNERVDTARQSGCGNILWFGEYDANSLFDISNIEKSRYNQPMRVSRFGIKK